jgi:hypothetical protein
LALAARAFANHGRQRCGIRRLDAEQYRRNQRRREKIKHVAIDPATIEK